MTTTSQPEPGADQDPDLDPQAAADEPARTTVPHIPDLPIVTKILLLVLGWLLLLIGIAGLVLPGIQGIVTIAAGGAILSLTSRTMLRALRWCFRPWPNGWRKVLRQRQKVLDWLTRGRDDA